MRSDIISILREEYRTLDYCNIDAEISDCVLQAGLFGEVIYG